MMILLEIPNKWAAFLMVPFGTRFCMVCYFSISIPTCSLKAADRLLDFAQMHAPEGPMVAALVLYKNRKTLTFLKLFGRKGHLQSDAASALLLWIDVKYGQHDLR